MPQLELFVVADSVVIDKRTDRASIFQVLDELRPRRFPARLTRLTALSTWLLSEQEIGVDFQVSLRITGPLQGDQEPFAQNFTAERRTQRITHLLIGGVVVTGPGILRFEVRINDGTVAHHTILIHDADPSEPAEGIFLYRPQPAANAPPT